MTTRDGEEPIEELAQSFFRDLRAERRAERTITIYSQAIRFYVDWLEGNGLPATRDQITRENIKSWLASLRDSGLEPSTRKTRFASLRRFCRWAATEEMLTDNPMAGMSPPEVPERHVPVFSGAEISALIKACKTGTAFEARRDEAILRLLDDTGMRISECAGLNVDDMDPDQMVAIITGKGSRPRVCPFGARAARAVDRYLRLRRIHRYAAEGGLWLGERGVYTADGIDERLKRRAALAGIEDVHAHRFRHTFAHQWLAAGGQERTLMRLAGWRSSAMLARY